MGIEILLEKKVLLALLIYRIYRVEVDQFVVGVFSLDFLPRDDQKNFTRFMFCEQIS